MTDPPASSDLTLLFIRHADKPVPGGATGVDANGDPDPRSLTPRGWQRAGAWAQLFCPALGMRAQLPVPTTIFAADPGTSDGSSRRPLETVTPLAARLGIAVRRDFAKGQEVEIAKIVETLAGTVLTCWQHENIHSIVGALDDPPKELPTAWPATCFNGIYRLDRMAGGWRFALLMPELLDDDEKEPF